MEELTAMTAPPPPLTHPEDRLPDRDIEVDIDAPDLKPTVQHIEHDGPQTGVKGVRADAKARELALAETRRELVSATRAEQERRALLATGGWVGNLEVEAEAERVRREGGARRAVKGGKGVVDEFGEEGEEDEDEEVHAWRARRLAQLRGGAVREVGGEGFLQAVERPGWVLVVLHEPDIPRCASILAQAGQLRGIEVVSARASRLGFGLLPEDSTSVDMDDSEDEADWRRISVGSSSWRPGRKGKADPDVLPTVLAYRDGELARTWVRIDMEMKEGLEAFLRDEGVFGQVKCPISDDEEDQSDEGF